MPATPPAHARTRPLVARLWRATGATMRRRLDEAGRPELRPAHNVVLTRAGGEGRRVTAMAAEVGATKVAVTLLVDELQELGYVERVPDPSDGRAKLVRLTPAGEPAAAALDAAADAVERRFREVLGQARLERLRADLAELVIAAEEDRAEP